MDCLEDVFDKFVDIDGFDISEIAKIIQKMLYFRFKISAFHCDKSKNFVKYYYYDEENFNDISQEFETEHDIRIKLPYRIIKLGKPSPFESPMHDYMDPPKQKIPKGKSMNSVFVDERHFDENTLIEPPASRVSFWDRSLHELKANIRYD
eukprot:UN30155